MSVRIWNSATGHEIGILKDVDHMFMPISFSPDGTRIAVGSHDKTVRVWEPQTDSIALGPLEGHSDVVVDVQYSPDGRFIASGGEDKLVKLWDTDTGACVATLKHDDAIECISFSPDGRHIATACRDFLIRIWVAEEAKLALDPLSGHIDRVRVIA